MVAIERKIDVKIYLSLRRYHQMCFHLNPDLDRLLC